VAHAASEVKRAFRAAGRLKQTWIQRRKLMWEQHCKGREIGLRTGRGDYDPARPSLLMVHGSGANKDNWRGQFGGLKGINVAAIDLPGHGDTPGPGMDKVEDYASWLAEFIASGPIRPVLMGHSLGGAIAQMLALTNPALLKGLILVGTGSRLKVLPAILEGFLHDPAATYKIVVKYAYDDNADPLLLERGYEEMVQRSPQVTFGDFSACNAFDVSKRLAEIRLPTLMIVGQGDKLTPPKYAEFLTGGIAGSKVVVIPNAGHMVPLEQPEAFNQAVQEFMAGV
jgi:pimeloyl-ACP methyl ester carboxylesterase